MSEPIETCVRTANTPAQAKIFVAMLQAEGIPARVEGESLTDEFATSRRMMNLTGTKVMVPTKSIERAREILEPMQVDPEALEREALATPMETPSSPRAAAPAPTGQMPIRGMLLVLAVGAAVLFGFLWRQAVDASMAPHPELEYAWNGDVLRETRRSDGRLLRLLHDTDRNGTYERLEQFDAANNKVLECDRETAGTYLRAIERRSGGMVATWTDDDGDGLLDSAVVSDRDGKVVQRLVWLAGTGYVLRTP